MNAIVSISDRDFVDALKRAPVGKTILAEDHARTVAARQKLIDEKATLLAKADIEFPRLEKAVQAEIKNVRASELALRDANEKLRLVGLAKSGASLALDGACQRIDAVLGATPAAKAIDEFEREMRDEIDAAMKRHEGGYVQESRPLEINPHYRVALHGYSNRPSVSARLDAIHAAMAEAERLRLAADQSDLAARLAALRGGLPEITGAVYPLIGNPLR